MSQATADTHGHADDHGHHGHSGGDPNLAHHFESMEQQLESGKFGMWVFLATEILMFGGLFCAYAIYRGNNPDVFLFAHKALDTQLGAINTAVLLASSFTMAWGVLAASRGKNKLCLLMVALTFLGGCGFMGIKSKEYNDKYGHAFGVGAANAFYNKASTFTNKADKNHGAQWIEDRAAIHGDAPGSDHGDAPADAQHHEASASPDDHGKAAPTHEPTHNNQPAVAAWPPLPADRASIAPPTNAPSQIADNFAHPADQPSALESLYQGAAKQQALDTGESHYPKLTELDPLSQERVHIFFQIYFVMTGLHGIHVLIGMGILLWIAWRVAPVAWRPFVTASAPLTLGLYFVFLYWLTDTQFLWMPIVAVVSLLATAVVAVLGFTKLKAAGDKQGDFSPGYYTPVEIGGLYWHLVDLIWIFLFPLLYLIH